MYTVTHAYIDFVTTGKSFVALVRYLFTLPDVKSFLRQRVCQDPLERFFFGCQRQRGGVHNNPNVKEFTKNTQAIRVMKSAWKGPARATVVVVCKIMTKRISMNLYQNALGRKQLNTPWILFQYKVKNLYYHNMNSNNICV